jgi:hypothetical protein
MDWSNITPQLKLTSQRITSRWLIGVEYLIGPMVLRLKAKGEWEPFSGFRCGPDGTSTFQLAPERMVITKGSPGCLIGKLGGSCASLDETGNILFAIGMYAVISVPDKFVGPLFIGFNLDRTQVGLQLFDLELTIETAAWPFPAPPPPAEYNCLPLSRSP